MFVSIIHKLAPEITTVQLQTESLISITTLKNLNARLMQMVKKMIGRLTSHHL